MTAVIQTKNLSKWYGNVLGLSDVSLEIDKGITGLLGPNGAGKSTFMKLVTGQLRPNIGRVLIGGRDVWNNFHLFRGIGFCPEQDAFYEDVTGWEFLTGLLRLYGFPAKEVTERAVRALDIVELSKDKDRKVRSYSRGMRQRVKFAQAVAHDPEIIILDEPLSGLDPLGKRRLIRLIKDFQSAGKTIIVSSHVLPEIEAMTSRVIMIHQGKILAQGDIHSIRDLIETYPHMISIRCSDARALAARFVPDKSILKMSFGPEGRSLVVETHQRDAFFSRLQTAVVEGGIEVEEISSPDDNLQAVFDYLVVK
ncbi:MAG: ABC transporter ATP-binding protein [Candidatus Aminicenantales bacterium]